MPRPIPTSLLHLPDDVLLLILRMVAFASVCNSRARPLRQSQFDVLRSLHPHLYSLSLHLLRSMHITATHIRAPLSTLDFQKYPCPVAGCVAWRPADVAPCTSTGTGISVLLFLFWHRTVDQLDVADGELCPHASLALLRRLERAGRHHPLPVKLATESQWSATAFVRKVVLREHRSEMEALGDMLRRLPRLTNIAIKTPSLRTVQHLIARQLSFKDSSTSATIGTGAPPRLCKPPIERIHAVAALKVLHLLCINREAMALLKRFLRYARPLCSIMLHTSYFDFVEDGGIDTNRHLDVSEWSNEARYIAAAHAYGVGGSAVLLGKRSIREAMERVQKQYVGNQYVIEVDPDTDFVSSGIDAEALGLGRPSSCTPDDGLPLLCARAGSRTFTIEITPTMTKRETSVNRPGFNDNELSVNEAALYILYHLHPVTLRLTRRRYKPIYQYGCDSQYSAQWAIEEEEAQPGTPNKFNIDETRLDDWCPCFNTARTLTPTLLATRPFVATSAIEGSFCVVREQYVPVARLLSTTRRDSYQYILREDRIPDADGSQWNDINHGELDHECRRSIDTHSWAMLYSPKRIGEATIPEAESRLAQQNTVQRSCFHVVVDFNRALLRRVYHRYEPSTSAQCVSIRLESFLAIDDDGGDDDDDGVDQETFSTTNTNNSSTTFPMKLLTPTALFLHGHPNFVDGFYADDETRKVDYVAWEPLPFAIERCVRLSTVSFLSLHASIILSIIAPKRVRTVPMASQGLDNQSQAGMSLLSSLVALKCIHIVGSLTCSTHSGTSSLRRLCDLLSTLSRNDLSVPSQFLCPSLRCITWHAAAMPGDENFRNRNGSRIEKASSEMRPLRTRQHVVDFQKEIISTCIDRIAELNRCRPEVDICALRSLLRDRGAHLDRQDVHKAFRLDDLM